MEKFKIIIFLLMATCFVIAATNRGNQKVNNNNIVIEQAPLHYHPVSCVDGIVIYHYGAYMDPSVATKRIVLDTMFKMFKKYRYLDQVVVSGAGMYCMERGIVVMTCPLIMKGTGWCF